MARSERFLLDESAKRYELDIARDKTGDTLKTFGGRRATEISPRRSHPAQRAGRGGEAEAGDRQAVPAGADRRSPAVRGAGTQEGHRRDHRRRLI